MMSDEFNGADIFSPKPAAQPAVIDPDLLDDGDEINLESETVPSRLCLSDDVPALETKINSIEDHQESLGSTENYFASISPEPASNSIQITIDEFEKRGDGINAYLVYKVVTKVKGVVGYSKEDYEVWRRFSDFLGLHEKMHQKYISKGMVIPSPPEKSISALTKTKTASDPNLGNEVGKQRSGQLERFLRRLAQHQRLRTDCDVRDFLTLEADLPKSSQTSALSGAGVRKMFKSFGDVFTKMVSHMEEGDRWFEQVQSQVEEIDETLKKLLSTAENLATWRKSISTHSDQLRRSLSMMATCEEHPSLSKVLSDLTDTTDSLVLTWQKQSDLDNAKLVDGLQEYVGLFKALGDVFEERVKAWQNWQSAQQQLVKKQDLKSRLELSGRNDRAEQMKGEIDETVTKMDELEQNFVDLSKLIREEYERFETERRTDMTKLFIDYLESCKTIHVQMQNLWEKFEPSVESLQL